MKVLEVKNLKRKMGKKEIIKDLSFEINEGEIFGFLGPNGAGKTTTIKMLVGLIKADSGEIKICGHNLKTERVKALEYVGAVVENPELYKYLSGRENLMQIARIRKVSKERVEEVISLIGMEKRINDKVSKYSLGMKQRLGLGIALMAKPKLLILDEPTNGLDPTGILDFRYIVQKASREEGLAVLVSSHILGEVQNLCDKVAFTNNGVIKSIEEIDKENNKIKTETELICLNSNDDKEKLKNHILSLDFVNFCEEENASFKITMQSNKSFDLISSLVMNKFTFEEIYKERDGLEQRYMELMEGGIN